MSDNSQIGRVLGIDYGIRRIGVAVSDPLRISAQSLPTINSRGAEQVFTELEAIIQHKNVSEIVVGLPLNLKGAKTISTQKVEEFIEQLKNRFQIPVHSWDERWTSIAAQKTIRQFGKSPSRHKEKIDQIAALLILQSYLDFLSAKAAKETEF